jgi:hypothetical protein
MDSVRLAGAPLIPLSEQSDGVLHHHTFLLHAFETQQPVFGIAFLLAAKATEVVSGELVWGVDLTGNRAAKVD